MDSDGGIQLNHTIVWCHDKQKSAKFFTEVMGLTSPTAFGPMLVCELDNNVSLDFYNNDRDISPQHYAFLISETKFDQIFDRVCARGIKYWAGPGKDQPGQINRNDGGRGMYFEDLDGHLLEIITRPYGSSG